MQDEPDKTKVLQYIVIQNQIFLAQDLYKIYISYA